MKLRSILKFFPALAAIAPLSMAAAVSFGRFGESLDQAKKTGFFTWFHLEQTSATSDTRTFQPSGAKFHDLVKVEVNVRQDGSVRGMVLAVKRSFIDGPNGVFAKDIAKSFLETAIAEPNQDVSALINQIWHTSSRGQTVIVHGNTPRPELPATPTPAYRVYTGQSPTWSTTADRFKLRLDNSDGWLYITVR